MRAVERKRGDRHGNGDEKGEEPQPDERGDARALRHTVPENRLRAYDMRALIRTLADEGSVLELRAGFGQGLPEFDLVGAAHGGPLGCARRRGGAAVDGGEQFVGAGQ